MTQGLPTDDIMVISVKKWAWRAEFKFVQDYLHSLHANALEKGMNPSLFSYSPAIGKLAE